MKVKSSVKLKESDKKRKDVYIVRRRGRLYLIDKRNPRRKTRQG